MFLWLGLLSLPAQALILGNLTVSSNASPSFTASLPFSDDKPVRLPELQTRLATDAEYAQWGMQMASAVRELRLRVVPASQTVGYVELYSPTSLSQDNFDLLVWASYAGQTMLTHYKVVVLDVPSLIKGKTLSMSQPSSTARQSKGLPAKSELAAPPKTNASAEVPPSALAQPNTSPSLPDVPGSKLPDTVQPTASAQPASLPPAMAVVAASQPALGVAENTSSIFSSSGVIVLFSLMLFLFGYWMGRLRRTSSTHKPPALDDPASAMAAVNLDKPSAGPGLQAPHWPTRPPESPLRAPVLNAQLLQQPLPVSDVPTTHNTVLPTQAEPVLTSHAAIEVPQPAHAPHPAFASKTTEAERSPGSGTSHMTPTATAAPEGQDNSEWPANTHPASFATHTDVLPATVVPSQALRLNAEPVVSGELSDWVPTSTPPSNSVAPVAVVARTPATALPTPGLVSVSGRTKKAGKTKSLGDSNIDLAKIYMSMGDPTTAQLLLQQVMEQGTAAEKAQAEQLMQEMV